MFDFLEDIEKAKEDEKVIKVDKEALDFAASALPASILRAYLWFYSQRVTTGKYDFLVPFTIGEIEHIYTLSNSDTKRAVESLIEMKYLVETKPDSGFYYFYPKPQFTEEK